MKALLLDFEATGVEPSKARPIEVAASLVGDNWDVVKPDYTDLIWESGYPAITEEVEVITKISQQLLLDVAIPPRTAFERLHAYGHAADVVIAFNAPYDQGVYEAECRRQGIFGTLLERPWLCALRDVPWFDKPKKLMYSALDAGVAVNPKLLHRAIADVALMAQMLRDRGLSVSDLMKYFMEPSLVVRAKVSYDDRQLAKDAGYSWEQVNIRGQDKRFAKSWVKVIKESTLDQERLKPFAVEVLL